jgi:cyclopropane fatty-acyl-phospholipid synthase-like methyltransferase
MSSDLVKESYNKIAEDYSSQRDVFKNNKYLEKLIQLLKPHARILDLGCGSGVPIDKYLVDKGFKVTGIDISEKQIELAKRNVLEAVFEVKDMANLQDGEFEVDAVVSFYAIFHIPRKKHEDLLRQINSFLPLDGLILITMGSSEWEGVEENFHGSKMWWSHYGAEKNREIVQKAGFKILLDEIDTTEGEKHQVIIAQKV